MRTADDMWAALLQPNAYGPVVVKKFPPPTVPKGRPYRHGLNIVQESPPMAIPAYASIRFKFTATLPRTEWACRFGVDSVRVVNSSADIILTVCNVFGVQRAGLISPRRARELTVPRFAAALLFKEFTTHSLPMIGRKLGGRDHTTIMHALDRAAALMESDPEFRAKVDEARGKLRAVTA